MNQKVRYATGYTALAITCLSLATLLLTMVGPARLLYEDPPRRGTTEPLNAIYLISPTKDVITVGKRQVDLVPQNAVLEDNLAVTLTRTPTGSGLGKGDWVVAAEEASPTPVLLNGARPTGDESLQDNDVLTIGGVEITYTAGRKGIVGALDWWESGKVSHLFASPQVISEAFPVLLAAYPISLIAVFVSFLLAIPGGLALAFMKMAKSRWFRFPATAYVDFVRGTPIFLQILLVFFGLPLMPPWQLLVSTFPAINNAGLFGVSNSMWLRAFVVLSFNSAAYMAEIFRAGIQSINKGQMEAARSLGMSTAAAMAFVIIPQTVRRILPTMMSEFILLFKDTSLFAAVGLMEIVMRAREVASTTLNVSAYLLAAVFYLVITIPLGRIVQQMENRLAASEGGGTATFEKSTEDNIEKVAKIKQGLAEPTMDGM
ncbi:MAG: amino acid ABC transporter permease [Coriobacteriia bacterium]|nr:amino acid ABC transporter permease [Coriobacteriia bacterium]